MVGPAGARRMLPTTSRVAIMNKWDSVRSRNEVSKCVE
jgi:hypothetical protein